jgi:Uma2 family endonuclease
MAPQTAPDPELVRFYEEAERKYLRSLPPEHFMEAFAQGTQRKITLESFDLIGRARPEVQCFNELLVQYPRPGRKTPGQVVPDNLVVVHPEPLQVRGSFAVELQPARPFLVIEYVSKQSRRKDYDDNLRRYERELRVPYYLLFYPDNEELTLFRLAADRYAPVGPIVTGRQPVPELELEVALLDGWVRYWFRGQLLPLPADLADRLDEERAARAEAERERDAAERERDAANERASALEAEVARLREELARARGG